MEQLLVLSRHDGESVLSQLLLQFGWEIDELMRIEQVGQVHAQSFRHVEVMLHQFLLAFLQFLHECLFLVGVLDGIVFHRAIELIAPRLILDRLHLFNVSGVFPEHPLQ